MRKMPWSVRGGVSLLWSKQPARPCETRTKAKSFRELSRVVLFLISSLLLPCFVQSAMVFARDGLQLSVDKNDLTAGDEVTVSASLPSDLKSYAILATLKYDENVFETIDKADFEIDEDQMTISYNPSNNKFGIVNKSGDNSSDLFKVRLKVKEDAKPGDSNIALTNVSTSEGAGAEQFDMASITVSVTRDAKDGESVPILEENVIVEDEETTISALPLVPILWILVILAVLLTCFLVYAYIYKKRTHDDINNKGLLYSLIVLDLILIAAFAFLFYFGQNKKDVNNDGEKNYDDATAIIDYLIGINNEGTSADAVNVSGEEYTSSSSGSSSNSANPDQTNSDQTNTGTTGGNQPQNPSDFDINGDGDVDVDDPGSLVPDVNEELKVSLSAQDNGSPYVKKGTSMTLNFGADINKAGITVKQVKIGDDYYDVTLNSDGTYTLVMDAPTEAGKHDYNISEVVLNNGDKKPVELQISKEVLKDVPYVNRFNLDDEKKKLSFQLEDDDQAFISGNVTVYDGNHQKLAETAVEKDKTTLDFKGNEQRITTIALDEASSADDKYIVEVKGNYDLDSDQNDGHNAYNDQDMHTQHFVIGGDYNFVLSEFSITDAIHEGETPVISFNSSNTRGARIAKVNLTIDGQTKEYNITNFDGDYYEVELTGVDTNIGEHTVTLNNVELDSLRTFYNDMDFKVGSLVYTVLRNEPSVKEFKVTNDGAQKKIDVELKLDDDITNLALRTVNIVLVDSTGKIVAKQDFAFEEFYFPMLSEELIKLSLSYKGNNDGLYTVKVLADYELSEKYKYTDKELAKESVLTFSEDDIAITNMTVREDNKNYNRLYPAKNTKAYVIDFTVHVGDSIKQAFKEKQGRDLNTLPAITINGLTYQVSAVTGSTASDYKVATNLIIPNESGIFDIKATRVQLATSGYYNMNRAEIFNVKEKSLQIDVLKDVPKIENLNITDNYEKGETKLKFDVVLDEKAPKTDNDFKDGKVKLGEKESTINIGHNEIVFSDVDKDKNLGLVFSGTYDLDTDTLPESTDQNTYTGKEIYKTEYGLYNDEIYDQISIINGQTISEKGNQYFEKNEAIKLRFGIDNVNEKLAASPSKVLIDGKEYTLAETEDGFEVTLNGFNTPGKKELTLSNIILSNGKKITLTNPEVFKPEVLKDIPEIIDFDYEDFDSKFNISSNLKDNDNAIIGQARMKISSEGGEVLYEGNYENPHEVEKKEGVSRYYVEITADFDRDIDKNDDGENYHENVTLLDELVSFEKNYIELKDISDISLYKKAADYLGRLNFEDADGDEGVDINDLKQNPDQYFVEIKMVDMPTTRAEIADVIDGSDISRAASENENKLRLELEYDFVTAEGSVKTDRIRIDYGTIKDGKAKNEVHPDAAFNLLLEKLRKGENVTLNQDYDAYVDLNRANIENLIPSGNAYVDSYSGTLDGNGYTIRNLDYPLFEKLEGTVSNLNLENVAIYRKGNGALANNSENATIDNVAVKTVTKSDSDNNNNGGLIGIAKSTTIKNSRVVNASLTNANIRGAKNNGLLVGTMKNSTVENSYATGVIRGGDNTNGLVGKAESSTFKNNYVKVDTGGYGFTNSTGGSASSYENNVAIVSGNSKQFINDGSSATLTNNYFLREKEEIVEEAPCEPIRNEDGTETFPEGCDASGEENDGDTADDQTEMDSTIAGVTNISKAEVNNELFKNAGFNEEIWSIENASYDNTPVFQSEKTTSFDTDNNEYDESKSLLYGNLLKLAPFYSIDKIIDMAKNFTDPQLQNVAIAHVVPVSNDGTLVTYLTTDEPKKISKIKLIFEDGKKAEYKVLFDRVYDMVAAYKISELGIDYNYNHYVINANSQVVNNLTNYLKGLDYTNNLDILTANDDSRIYRDFYNETTKNELREFVLKYLSNTNYTNTTDNALINGYIEKEVKRNKKIENALYVYNYFRRFYDLDISGIKLYDFIMFNMQGFDKSLKTEKIVELYLDQKGENFNTAETNTRYNNILSNYTKQTNIPKLLEYLVKGLSDQDLHEWTRQQFKGILVEVPVNGHPEVQYTLWDHLSTEDAKYSGKNYPIYNFVLPLLTMPETAAYLISAPAQITLGSQRTYMGNPDSPVERAAFDAKMKVYVDRISLYYNTLYSILGDATLFNNMHLYQLDKRATKNVNNNTVYNYPFSTEELFHKNFDEVTNVWPAQYGVAAGNWGNRIEWNAEGFMDSNIQNDGKKDPFNVTWTTWSHESAHYFDGRLFLKDYDRRFDAGGEDYADEMFMQDFFYVNGLVMNISKDLDPNQEFAYNLTPERINSKEKIHDFYRKMFESIYAVDYIEAMAFLQLSEDEQKNVATQVSYPNENKKFITEDGAEHNFNEEPDKFIGQTMIQDQYAQYRARETSAFTPLSEVKESVKLNSIDDLIDNKIMIYPGITGYSTRGNNKYGGEGINVAHWYQPNNPYGRPDSYALKWFSYEMLGYKGYDEGFVEYASNIHNDPEKKVYRSIGPTSSADQLSTVAYKSDNMAITKISNNQFTTVDDYKKWRFEATGKNLPHIKFIKVDEYVQKMLEALKKDSSDVKKEFNNSFKIRKEIYYTLKNNTNDFVDEIYDQSLTQDINFDPQKQPDAN